MLTLAAVVELQGGGEKLTDEAIEDTLEKVVKLLAYISDKDLFAEFYRKKLARRLLQDRSSSDEHERSILSRLKQQCGAQFTSKVASAATAHTCLASLLVSFHAKGVVLADRKHYHYTSATMHKL